MGQRVFDNHRAWSGALQDGDTIKAFVMVLGERGMHDGVYEITANVEFPDLPTAERTAAAIIDRITTIDEEGIPCFGVEDETDE
jgi:hypothetical protein